MALSFTEKQHWKSRIEAKIGQHIARLRAENASLIDELDDRAGDEVAASLGLTGDFEEPRLRGPGAQQGHLQTLR